MRSDYEVIYIERLVVLTRSSVLYVSSCSAENGDGCGRAAGDCWVECTCVLYGSCASDRRTDGSLCRQTNA